MLLKRAIRKRRSQRFPPQHLTRTSVAFERLEERCLLAADLLKDINATSLFADAPKDFVNFNGSLIFTVVDPLHGRELWISDGTAAGTEMLQEFTQGAAGSRIENLTVVGDDLFFTVQTGTDTELWKTDGSGDGAELVQDELGQVHHLTDVAGDAFLFGEWKGRGEFRRSGIVEQRRNGCRDQCREGHSSRIGGQLSVHADGGG